MIGSERMKQDPHRIPTELLSEILSRLPARSVIRFRCVCKLWRFITHDPYFIDAHLQRATISILLLKSILISPDSSGRKRINTITILDKNWAPKPSLTRGIPQDSPSASTSLITSCNGLLCFRYGGDTQRMKLFNPATQESLTSPTPTKSNFEHLSTVHFGFHPTTKDYKLIHFFAKTSTVMACEVYTIGTTSWREICNLNYRPLSTRGLTTVKGAIYFQVTTLTSHVVPDIVSFDLKDERFTPFSLPNFELIYGKEMHEIYIYDLVELQGSLCISVCPCPNLESMHQPLDIWMLDDDHGTKHHWTRKCSIITYGVDFPPHILLIHKEKILLNKTCPKSVLSNIEYGSLRQSYVGMLRFHHLKSGTQEVVYWKDEPFIYPFVHVESLVQLQKPKSQLRTRDE